MIIPEHVVMLFLVVAIAWFFFRWGELIFFAYALYHFWNEQWDTAIAAFALATLLAWIKAVVMWLSRAAGYYRDEWI